MFVSPVVAQEEQKEEKEEGYIFTDIKVLPVTSVKDQNAAGTCWCYSGLAFFEAELLRMGKPEYDFRRCILFTTHIWTVPRRQYVLMVMCLSHKAAHFMTSFMV